MNELLASAVGLVREFHVDKGLPVAVSLDKAVSHAQLKELGNRVVEEALELRRAVKLGDLAEVVKELADVVYSALGTAVAFDLSLDDALASLGVLGPPNPVGDGLLDRPIAAVRALLVEQGDQIPVAIQLFPRAPALSERIVGDSLILRDSLAARRKNHVERRLAILLLDSCSLAVLAGVPLSTAFADIHRNNMTKEPARQQRGVARKPQKGPDFEKVDLTRLLASEPEADQHSEGEPHRD